MMQPLPLDARTRRVGIAVGILLLGACATSAPNPALVEADGPVLASVFSEGYDSISDYYLQRIALGDLTVDGLSGLSAIDDRLSVARDADVVQMSLEGAVIGEFEPPAARNPYAWANLTVSAIASAQQASPEMKEATPEEIYDAIYTAITETLDDYSRYSTAEKARQERAFREGYGGIGLLLNLDEAGRAIVEEVFDDGPAGRAGIVAGEVIVAVDGEDAVDWTLEKLGSRLRGLSGTEVQVTVLSIDGVGRTLTLRRERVIPNVINTQIENDTVIVRISRFNASTRENLKISLTEALNQLGSRAKGVILDLRGNPGGLLDQATKVADLFIPDGRIITTNGRHPDSLQHSDADDDDLAHGLPVVVLIDGRSASGAEVVAAALQDSGRAVLVGATSFGKGSVQRVVRLDNDGELYLTWSRIYAPSGYTLHRQGVMPTICTSGPFTDADMLISMFRDGEMALTPRLANYRFAAPDDEEALDALRQTCPWQDHDDALDLEVAQRVIEDETLYAQGVAAYGQASLAQR